MPSHPSSDTTPQLDTLSFLVDGRPLLVEGRPPADIGDQSLSAALQLFELAETFGYDSGWLRDHPAPLAVLAALSQRTRRLQLGAWVSVAARVDGDLLVADLATVDELSAGRLQVLLGPAAGGSSVSHGQGGSVRRVLLPLDSAGAVAAERFRTLADRLPHGASSFDVPVLVGSSDHLLDVLAADPLIASANDLRVELPAGLPTEDLAQVLHDVATYLAPELGWGRSADAAPLPGAGPAPVETVADRAA